MGNFLLPRTQSLELCILLIIIVDIRPVFIIVLHKSRINQTTDHTTNSQMKFYEINLMHRNFSFLKNRFEKVDQDEKKRLLKNLIAKRKLLICYTTACMTTSSSLSDCTLYTNLLSCARFDF